MRIASRLEFIRLCMIVALIYYYLKRDNDKVLNFIKMIFLTLK